MVLASSITPSADRCSRPGALASVLEGTPSGLTEPPSPCPSIVWRGSGRTGFLEQPAKAITALMSRKLSFLVEMFMEYSKDEICDLLSIHFTCARINSRQSIRAY